MSGYANNNLMAETWVVEKPYIYNISMTNANTQYSQVLPDGCKRFTLKLRQGLSNQYLRFSYETNKVATPTAPYGEFTGDASLTEDGLNLSQKTLYVACSNAGKVAELFAWV